MLISVIIIFLLFSFIYILLVDICIYLFGVIVISSSIIYVFDIFNISWLFSSIAFCVILKISERFSCVILLYVPSVFCVNPT